VEALLAHPGLQVVHNCTPNHLHAQINRQILAAGLHVFSEKPLCMTAEEARELVALAEQAGVVHGVSFVYRQFAMVQQAAAMIRRARSADLRGARQLSAGLDAAGNRLQLAGRFGAGRRVADGGRHRLPLVRYRAVYDRSADCRGDGGSVYRLADA
jgi:predicted dehydrogenase